MRVFGKSRENPFILLVSIILSQNTSDSNAIRALENLEKLGLTEPTSIVNAGLEKVLQAVQVSGLGKIKAERIMKLSEFLLERRDFLEKICEKGEKARDELMQLRGIGPKTADVFLLIYCGIPTFPVDRHINRVTERIVGKKMSYDETSAFWKEKVPPEKYREAHLKLIFVGRKYCRPANPRCEFCPFNKSCSSSKITIR
ncbi:MAG: endonuclease III domain-containing protein [Fervidicoccaceae archaeon]